MTSGILKNSAVLRYAVAMVLVVLASGLRIWPLSALEIRIPWVTFYPAVMAASLFGGFTSGLLATVLSALVVIFWSPTELPFIDDYGDWMGLAVFCINGLLISIMSGAMHRARAKAKKAQQLAEAANQAKSAFLANMSHELRTPLNAILGYSQLMKNSSDITADQTENLSIIYNSGEHLLNLINNILDISKIEAGHMIKEESRLDLKRFLNEIKTLMEIEASKKGLSLILKIDPEVKRVITVDAIKLRQILINLIGNAIKFTEKGSIELQVESTPQDSLPSAKIKFRVKDSGTGISKEEQEIIFNPFEQGADVKTSSSAGTGLGLAICKQYVEFMGGCLAVISHPGEGALFHFEIPVSVDISSEESSAELQMERVIGLEQEQQSYRLLITEDKQENRKLLLKILEPLGFEIREAKNGQEAVDLFHQWHPHLIWMDIRMPVMNGMEATRQIKKTEAGAHTMIVALTAHALEDERREILASGCDDFIRKPFRDTDIFEALIRHLGVRFRYSTEKTLENLGGPIPLDTAKLKTLPPALLKDLKNAAVLLEDRLCLNIAERISDHDKVLGTQLRTLIQNLQYKEILIAVENTGEKHHEHDPKQSPAGY